MGVILSTLSQSVSIFVFFAFNNFSLTPWTQKSKTIFYWNIKKKKKNRISIYNTTDAAASSFYYNFVGPKQNCEWQQPLWDNRRQICCFSLCRIFNNLFRFMFSLTFFSANQFTIPTMTTKFRVARMMVTLNGENGYA